VAGKKPANAKKDADKSGGDKGGAATAPSAAPASAPPKATWKNVWNVPAVIVSTAALVAGLGTLLVTTPPDEYGPKIIEAETLQKEGKFAEALPILTELAEHKDALNGTQRSRFLRVRADVYHGKQTTEGGAEEANFERIAEDYEEAVKLGAELTPVQLYRLADAQMALGRTVSAMETAGQIPAEAAELRDELTRSVIDHALARDGASEQAVQLLNELLADPNANDEDRRWGVQRRAELLLNMGHAEDALASLLFWIPRLGELTAEERAPLAATLGRAHYDLGEYERATSALNDALPLLGEDMPERAETLYYLGRVAQMRNEWDEALARFDQVVREYPAAAVYGASVLGRGEAYGRLGMASEARDDFRGAAAELMRVQREGRGLREVTLEGVTESLEEAHDRTAAQGDYESALLFIEIAESLNEGKGTLPASLAARLASSHLQIAEEALARGGAGINPESPDEGVATALTNPERMDPTDRLVARENFLAAARYFREYSAAMLTSDPEISFTALSDAAKAFDRGGDVAAAIDTLNEYVAAMRGRPDLYGAVQRLGRLYESAGDFANAATQYRRLVEDPSAGRAPEGLASIVPLARCLLNDRKAPRAADAERLLLSVVEGGVALDPSSDEYFDALVEIGTLYARAGEYKMPNPPETYLAAAIARLTEARERRPQDARSETILYLLAHAHREAAEGIEKLLEVSMPEEDREALTADREAHLRVGAETYAEVVKRYAAVPTGRLGMEQAETLMLARFWHADCVFELKQYREATALYSAIADQYPRDPAGVVALIQIVNAQHALGDDTAAEAAHQRAVQRIAQLPADEGSLAIVNLDRSAWERLLGVPTSLADAGENAGPEGER